MRLATLCIDGWALLSVGPPQTSVSRSWVLIVNGQDSCVQIGSGVGWAGTLSWLESYQIKFIALTNFRLVDQDYLLKNRWKQINHKSLADTLPNILKLMFHIAVETKCFTSFNNFTLFLDQDFQFSFHQSNAFSTIFSMRFRNQWRGRLCFEIIPLHGLEDADNP